MLISCFSAKDSDRIRVQRAIGWCRRNNLTLAGLPYDEKISVREGVSLEIIAPPGISRVVLEQAVLEAHSEREDIRHRVLECPLSWFTDIEDKTFDHVLFHSNVVSHGFGEPSIVAYELAEKWFWQGYDYALIAAEVVSRGLCITEDEDDD